MRTPGGHVAARRARPRTPRRAHRAKQAWSKSLTSLAVLGADGARAAPPHPQPPQTAWVGAQRAGGSLRAHARRRQVPVHTAAQQQRILQGRPRPLPAGRLRVAGPGSGRQAGPGHADLRARLPLLADTALSSCALCAPCAPPTHTALRLPIASPFAQENSIFIFLQAIIRTKTRTGDSNMLGASRRRCGCARHP